MKSAKNKMAKKMVDGCGGPGLLKIPDNYSGNTNKATTDFTRQLMPPQAKSALSPAVGRLETQPVVGGRMPTQQASIAPGIFNQKRKCFVTRWHRVRASSRI